MGELPGAAGQGYCNGTKVNATPTLPVPDHGVIARTRCRRTDPGTEVPAVQSTPNSRYID